MKVGKVLIFGDSYSTYTGYVPEGYACYYPPTNLERPSLGGVNETWWHSLISETSSELILNDSWSVSTVVYYGYGRADTPKTSSFINRLNKMISNEFFEKNKDDLSTCEFLFPDVLDRMIKEGKIKIKVLPTSAKWFGATYREDLDNIKNSIKELITEGAYKEDLWS